jgi:hypothetical protein
VFKSYVNNRSFLSESNAQATTQSAAVIEATRRQCCKSLYSHAESRTLNFSKIEKFELISLDSPFRSESKQLSESTPSNSVLGASRTAQPRRQEFESIWARFADPRGTARGWSSSPLSSISVILHEALPHYKFVIAPDSPSPFIEGASTRLH